jgi:uncharacterized protein
MISRRSFLLGAGSLFAGAASIGTYGFVIEPVFRLAVKEWTLRYPGQGPSFQPQNAFRIAALSDFHVANPWMTVAHITRIVDATMALNPDLIVLLGDYMPGVSSDWVWDFPSITEWTAALGRLKAPLGVYAVLGNHDTDFKGIRAGFTREGIPLLENRAVRIQAHGHDFWLAGLADQELRRANLHATLRQTNDERMIILLAHEPDIFLSVTHLQRRVALTLSGHTHGGQVWAPIWGNPIAEKRPYIYGHYYEEGRNLIVSGGLGCTRIPVRFMRPPEITLVHVGYPGPLAEGGTE